MLKPAATNFTFASLLAMIIPTWVIFDAIVPQVAWLIALIVFQLALSVLCYLRFRKEARGATEMEGLAPSPQ
jgi:hypothetical protein